MTFVDLTQRLPAPGGDQKKQLLIRRRPEVKLTHAHIVDASGSIGSQRRRFPPEAVGPPVRSPSARSWMMFRATDWARLVGSEALQAVGKCVAAIGDESVGQLVRRS